MLRSPIIRMRSIPYRKKNTGKGFGIRVMGSIGLALQCRGGVVKSTAAQVRMGGIAQSTKSKRIRGSFGASSDQ